LRSGLYAKHHCKAYNTLPHEFKGPLRGKRKEREEGMEENKETPET